MRHADFASRPPSTTPVQALFPMNPRRSALRNWWERGRFANSARLYVPSPKALTPTQKDQRHEARKAIDALFEPKSNRLRI